MKTKPCSAMAPFKMSEVFTQLACRESNRNYGTN